MGRDRLRLSGSREHEQLREDGDALEPDGEGPKDLGGDELVIEDQGQDGHGGEQVVQPEGIQRGIV